jgi:hypothetical protein
MKGYEIKAEGCIEFVDQTEETATLNVSGTVIKVNFGDDIKEVAEKVNKALKKAKKSFTAFGQSFANCKEFTMCIEKLNSTVKYTEPKEKHWLPGSFKKRGRR